MRFEVAPIRHPSVRETQINLLPNEIDDYLKITGKAKGSDTLGTYFGAPVRATKLGAEVIAAALEGDMELVLRLLLHEIPGKENTYVAIPPAELIFEDERSGDIVDVTKIEEVGLAAAGLSNIRQIRS